MQVFDFFSCGGGGAIGTTSVGAAGVGAADFFAGDFFDLVFFSVVFFGVRFFERVEGKTTGEPDEAASSGLPFFARGLRAFVPDGDVRMRGIGFF